MTKHGSTREAMSSARRIYHSSQCGDDKVIQLERMDFPGLVAAIGDIQPRRYQHQTGAFVSLARCVLSYQHCFSRVPRNAERAPARGLEIGTRIE